MSDAKRILVYCEGDDDRIVLVALQKEALIAGDIEIAKQRGGGLGLAAMLQAVASILSVGGRAIVVRDQDELQFSEIATWLSTGLSQLGLIIEPGAPPIGEANRVSTVSVSADGHTGHAAVVAIGLPADEEIAARHELQQFAMDDYLLRLAHQKPIYDAISEVNDVSHDVAMLKLAETRQLLRQNGIPVRHSKRLLHLLRGISDFRASPAAFAGRLVECAAKVLEPPALMQAFQPFLNDLEVARRKLTPQ